jgi:hypothetical protein
MEGTTRITAISGSVLPQLKYASVAVLLNELSILRQVSLA